MENRIISNLEIRIKKEEICEVEAEISDDS